MNPDPLPGYVWLDLPGKVLHAPAHELEVTDGPPMILKAHTSGSEPA